MPISIYAFLTMVALCTFAVPSQGAHLGKQKFKPNSSNPIIARTSVAHDLIPIKAACVLYGTCKKPGRNPTLSICRQDGLCIPETPAWTSNHPSEPAFAGKSGFSYTPQSEPVAVPLPASSLTYTAALLFLTLAARGRRQIR